MTITAFPAIGRVSGGVLGAFTVAGQVHSEPLRFIPDLTIGADPTSLLVASYKIDDPIDRHTEFFQSLGHL
jgi:hypothetical protein